MTAIIPSDFRSFTGKSAPFDEVLTSQPKHVWEQMRRRARAELYYLAAIVLGYDKLRPATHGPLCAFLDSCNGKRRLIQMPRSHLKTTICTIAQRIKDILNNPEVRILVVGDTEPNAVLHLEKISRHFEANNVLRWLFPERVWEDQSQAPMWSKTTIVVPNKAPHGEPTINAIGAGGAVVSRHFDIINADDIIGEDEHFSDVEMAKVIEWFTGLESLFVPPVDEGLLDIVGTYWRTDDVYAYAEGYYGGKAAKIPTGPYSYQRGALSVFRRSVREEGQIIFPEAVSEEFLQRLQERNPERYAAQYANDPYSADVAYFKAEYLDYYTWSVPGQVIRYTDAKGNVENIPVANLYIVSLCDPHAGGPNQNSRFRQGGRAAVLTTGVHRHNGRVFILDAWIKRSPTDRIITEIIRQNEAWMPEVFSIEANGLQKMLKYWLDERVEREGRISVPYQPYIPKGDKHGDRRIRGLQPLFRAGQIIGQKGFSELWDEYMAWPRGAQDGMDALSQGLDYWGVGYDSATYSAEMEQAEEWIRSQRNVATGY